MLKNARHCIKEYSTKKVQKKYKKKLITNRILFWRRFASLAHFAASAVGPLLEVKDYACSEQ
jgi:hypothetical protein